MIALGPQVAGSPKPAALATAHATQQAPVRAALRNATHAIHMRMHGLEQFQDIANARLPLDDYLQLLQSLLAYHSAISVGAARFGLAGLSSGARRLGLLSADIRSLGGVPLEQRVDWQPRTLEGALGGLYAAEGSMLGGRVIAGQLDYLFGATSPGRSFFIGTADDAANWRRLLALLELRCAASHDLQCTIEGALFSFELFEQRVRVPGDHRDAALGPDLLAGWKPLHQRD